MRKTTINPNEYNIGKYGCFYTYVDIKTSAIERNKTSVTALLMLQFNNLKIRYKKVTVYQIEN